MKTIFGHFEMIKLISESCISSKIFKWLNTLPFKNLKEMYTSVPQGCIKSTKSDSKNTWRLLVLGDMVIFHIVISPACEITDTRYYRAWVGVGKRETFCTCHMLFHNYLVIFGDFTRAWERESLEVPVTEIIYFQTYWKTNMLNIKIFKTASSYSDTAVIHRY